jgi:DNA polymerase-4
VNWLLTDMNSYFAAVEQHLRPELRGRAIGIVPVESDHTCIIAASVEAKRFGIKTGTRVGDARRMCPEILLVRARPKIYVQTHHAILRSVDQCAPVHKVYSIDEWTIQLVGTERKPENAVALARKVKRQLAEDFSPWLSCSIGIAPTRLLAKIATDLQKPNGLVVLTPEDLPHALEKLTLDDLCGIGHGMLARLDAYGVHSIPELWALTRQQAVEAWGSHTGGSWWAGFHGFDEPEFPTRRRSMSHANVLHPDFRNERDACGIMMRLVCRLGARLRHDGYFAQTLRAHVKDLRSNYWHDEIALPCVHDTPALIEKFQLMWRRRVSSGVPPLKVGVEVADLVAASQVSAFLFDGMEKPRRVSNAIDKINQRWGTSAIYFGSVHAHRHPMEDKIAFGRIPPVTM